MTDELRVTATRFRKGSNVYYLRWTDPLTGERKAKSAGTTSKREADKAAGKLEVELRSGKYARPARVTWQDFTWRHADEVQPGLAQKTRAQFGTVFNAVERIIRPKRLADLTAARLSAFAATLRAEGKSEATVKSYLAHLRSALQWAVNVGLLPTLPALPKVHRAKGGGRNRGRKMKGRPITGEEFDRMIAAVPKVVGERAADSWRFFLRGLWWSGLRLGEALSLRWEGHHGLVVDLSGRRPMIRIDADCQKSNEDETLPVAPEFATLLEVVPEDDRHGRVFKLRGIDAERPQGGGRQGADRMTNPEWVSRVMARIGRKAKVVVDRRKKRDPETGKEREVVRYATAHTCRRSFGTRWAYRVLPQVLQQLMRHENIETTFAYYVELEAERTADVVWEAWASATSTPGNTIGNTTPATG